MTSTMDEFDTRSAVTRSLLGWGVLAGPIYLAAGIAQGLLRDGFRFADHQLSLLMLGDLGWIQTVNLVLGGAMVGAAAVGVRRATSPNRAGRLASSLLLVFALGLVGSGIFPPDPMASFPPGARSDGPTASGLLHLGLGVVQFAALTAACFATAAWSRGVGAGLAGFSRFTGAVVLLGFLGGATLSRSPFGVALLWVAVVAGYAWLAVVCVGLWRRTPHPDPERRADADADAGEATGSHERGTGR